MLIYLSVALGVVISVALPIVRALLPKPPQALGSGPPWERVRPYVATGVFSLIVALLIVAAMGDKLDSSATALLAGYMWDSTLQKATTGNLAIDA